MSINQGLCIIGVRTIPPNKSLQNKLKNPYFKIKVITEDSVPYNGSSTMILSIKKEKYKWRWFYVNVVPLN